MTSQATRRRIEGDRPGVAAIGDSRPISDVPTLDLLRAAYSLTHQIETSQFAADLRAQRDLIDAEVLRRTGDAR